MIKNILNYPSARPITTIIAVIGITAILFCFLPDLQQEEDPWAIIPRSNQVRTYYYQVKDEFNLNDYIMVGIESNKTVFNFDTLKRLKSLTDRFNNITIVSEKLSKRLKELIADTSGVIHGNLKKIEENGINRDDVYLLSELEKLINNEEAGSGNFGRTDRLKECLDELRIRLFPLKKVNSLFSVENITLTDSGLKVEPLITKMPETETELAQAREETLSNELFQGIYISSDENETLIFLEMVFSESDMEKCRDLYYKVKEAIDSEPGREKVHLGGTPVLWVIENKLSNEDFGRLIPVVIIVVVALLFLFFRNFQAIYLSMGVVIISVIWTLSIMAICNAKLTIVSNTIPVILIAIGTADAIHILTHYYGELKKGVDSKTALQSTMANMALPVVLTSITTIVGFASLTTSKIPMIQNFGIFTAVGIFSAMVLSLTVIPAVLNMSKPGVVKSGHLELNKNRSGSVYCTWGRFLQQNKITALVIIVFAIGAAGYLTSRLVIEYSPKSFYKKSSDVRIAHEFFENHFAGVTELSVILDTNKDNSLKEPEQLRKLSLLQEKISGLDHVGKAFSVVDYVERMNYVMHDEDVEYKRVPRVKEMVKDVTWVMENGKEVEKEIEIEINGYDLVSQYFLLYESTEGKDLKETVDDQYKKSNTRVILDTDNSVINKDIIDKIKQYCNDLFPGQKITFSGISTLFVVMAEMIIKGQVWSIMVSIITIFFIIMLLLRAPIYAVIGIVPLCFTILFNFGIMTLLNIPLDVGTSIVGSIAIGIGVDYCIHFLSWMNREYRKGIEKGAAVKTALENTGKPIMINALIVGAGFLVLVFSNYVPVIHFGWLSCVTMLVCSFGTLTIIPTVMFLCSRKEV